MIHEFQPTDTFHIDPNEVFELVAEVGATMRDDGNEHKHQHSNKPKVRSMYDTDEEYNDYGYGIENDMKSEEKDGYVSGLGQNKANLSARSHEKELIADVREI